MGLKNILEDFENEKEPRLDEIIKWFKKNEIGITVSVIQRNFQMGWRQANRAMRQIKNRL